MGRLEVAHANCLRRIVCVELTDSHRLETMREQIRHVIAGVDGP